MKVLRGVLGYSVVLFLTLASIGCGSSNNPTSIITPTANPLVATYSIRQIQSGFTAWVEFGTDTSYGRQTSVMTDSSLTSGWESLKILVAGMRPQTTYHMRAHANWFGGSWIDQDRTFTTRALPTDAPLPQFSLPPPAPVSPGVAAAPGVELLSLVAANTLTAVATDLQGNVIWYCPGITNPVKLLQNGHLIINRSSALEEVDLACTSIRKVSVDQVNQSLQAKGYTFPLLDTFHHDVMVLPNGHWIALGLDTKTVTADGYGSIAVQGDALVDIDTTGEVAWAWSAFDHLDVNRHLQGLPDWTHSNAIVYTTDGNLLLSMRHQSWILKIDYAKGAGSGNILWRLGQDGDFTLLGGDSSQWFYGQHYPFVVSVDGSKTTLAIYDDGNLRIDGNGVACGPVPPAPACYTRATIFEINEETNVANLVWQDLPGFFSFWGGSISVLPNGNVEFDSSEPFGAATESQISEVTQTDSPQVVWQMNITGGFAYRGDRIPSLYPGVTWQK